MTSRPFKPIYFRNPSLAQGRKEYPLKDKEEMMEETDIDMTNNNNNSSSSHFNHAIRVPINSVQQPSPPSSSMSPKAIFSQIINPKKQITVNGITYNRLERIGSGSESKIYKVFDSNGDFYALKEVRYSDKSLTILENYENEIKLLQELQGSDRIINIIDSEINTNEKLILIVLELGDADLRSIISSQERLSPNYIRYTWQQMLEAVQTIHEKKIIHGNLKPSNFLMVKRTLKLIDFGFAKVIQDDATSTEFFRQSSSFQYKAPESFSDWKQPAKLSTSADVYSIGCILYELVYGRPPQNQANNTIFNNNVIKFEVLKEFPDFELLKNVMQMCLQPNPKRRPTIEELLNHAYIQLSTSFVPRPISTEENIAQFVKQIKLKYNDREFNCSAGHRIIERVVQDLINGRPMTIAGPRA
ncbi:Pkinase-domain-containing protein [Histomonas meleagridis]|uniref:Pkinase-domain-containing protein n=1 Tax=Histomonas meleagridis TaxID=135588 RepID=UPI00355AAA16|nr:Pkinase-domain-containing protein [Histomonas meleagridis]KAH0806922.1 Pkinase-domain-containing protein [Histomonas meleagridis]